MIILTIGVILFTLFIFFIIGLLTFTMLVNKATPQIYYTPCDSMTMQSYKKNRGKRS
ncbi:DUF3951 domain-containing protein [Bacillus sp. Xin]|uniref:DUF3951 domain-containing protein n=1 Tax=unclassified Bacillus (in: firmicutes) TaxID=185979 RepID=UPI001572859D|nr:MULTISPECIES: DUF3951 domain-containing protein [unclassified Bacillus (in: firmicutes)]MBC6974094.1 DUF3951 domain-containing protein [Bacillus sp. Xin]NSW39109.1 DUF3951 domain-containing protein [Bacillus sp. Xin1]